jgi:hypothetical protein
MSPASGGWVHPRGVWEQEARIYRNAYSWSGSNENRRFPSGPYDADATGRLRLELFTKSAMTFAERQWRWFDRVSWTLEKRLPQPVPRDRGSDRDGEGGRQVLARLGSALRRSARSARQAPGDAASARDDAGGRTTASAKRMERRRTPRGHAALPGPPSAVLTMIRGATQRVVSAWPRACV